MFSVLECPFAFVTSKILTAAQTHADLKSVPKCGPSSLDAGPVVNDVILPSSPLSACMIVGEGSRKVQLKLFPLLRLLLLRCEFSLWSLVVW